MMTIMKLSKNFSDFGLVSEILESVLVIKSRAAGRILIDPFKVLLEF